MQTFFCIAAGVIAGTVWAAVMSAARRVNWLMLTTWAVYAAAFVTIVCRLFFWEGI